MAALTVASASAITWSPSKASVAAVFSCIVDGDPEELSISKSRGAKGYKVLTLSEFKIRKSDASNSTLFGTAAQVTSSIAQCILDKHCSRHNWVSLPAMLTLFPEAILHYPIHRVQAQVHSVALFLMLQTN
jgi:hypothetical protein